MKNFVLSSDSYKYSHFKQYPPETTEVYSYFESRGGKFEKTIFFGLQYYLKNYLAGVVLTHADIDEAKKLIVPHMSGESNFNESGFRRIVDVHGGKLPLEIRAVPEGSIVETNNVLFTIRNTDPELAWLTNFTETLLSKLWYSITVATNSYECKKIIIKYLQETGCDSPNEEVLFKLHDFGYRGVATEEQAGIGGSSHLINFLGTDTVSALKFIQDFYNFDDVAGFSVPASEHSTITAWGRDRELDAYKNMLDQYPTGLVACVSDSYDFFNACWELWGEELKDQVMNRDGTLIIRPDSGDPASVVLKGMNILGDKFGFTVNSLGYKVLDPHVRMIQGDGVNLETIDEILSVLKRNKWAAENIGFGSGGALLQKFDRDTQKFAVKCSFTKNKFGDIDVFKNPETDPGKVSKKGKLKLIKTEKCYETVQQHEPGDDLLKLVFLNGEIMNEVTFDDIRKQVERG